MGVELSNQLALATAVLSLGTEVLRLVEMLAPKKTQSCLL